VLLKHFFSTRFQFREGACLAPAAGETSIDTIKDKIKHQHFYIATVDPGNPY